jgi:hypothetical protein
MVCRRMNRAGNITIRKGNHVQCGIETKLFNLG